MSVRNLEEEKKRRNKMKALLDKTEQPTDTDLANACRLVAGYGPDLHYTVERDWLVWDGRRFAVDEKSVRVQALAKQTARSIFDELKTAQNRDELYRHAKRSQSKVGIQAMEWLARSEPGVFARYEAFDVDPLLLNVANGTIDLRTGTLRPHDRADRLTMLTPIEYDPEATCELWDEVIWRLTVGREDLYNYLRRLVGYLLTGLTTEQVIVFLFGIGANGKTVFCEIVQALLGEYGTVALTELVLARRHGGIPNDIAALRGRRIAMMNETSQGSRFDEAKLKQLTGSDTLSGRFLHREFFSFIPTHKLVIRGNHKPTINGTDEGIWRRLHLVPFEAQIPDEEQDKGLQDKLKAELPGILAWAVQGCLEWQRDGLNPPGLVRAAVDQYRAESDVLGRFIEERCELDKLAEVKSSALFTAYRTYCEQAAERWITSKDLPGEMERRGIHQKRHSYGKTYQGIRLASPDAADWAT